MRPRTHKNVTPLLANPCAAMGIVDQDAPLVDFPVCLEALNVLQSLLEHRDSQHNGQRQECCDWPVRMDASLGTAYTSPKVGSGSAYITAADLGSSVWLSSWYRTLRLCMQDISSLVEEGNQKSRQCMQGLVQS